MTGENSLWSNSVVLVYYRKIMKNNCIILVGMMGSGKSTVGKMLATLLKGSFLDLDKILEFKIQMSIPQFFQERGEDAFRKAETQVLKSLLLPKDMPSVISTGGGIVLKPENRQLLKQLGQAVWLKVSPQIIVERLSDDTERPLLQAKNESEKLLKIENLIREREALYSEVASFKIEVDSLTPEQIAKKIIDYTF